MSSYMKKLIFESENILKEQQSKNFLELQNKFDKLYLNLSNELKAIEIVIQEIKLKKEIFIKKDEIAIKSIDKDLALLNAQKEHIKYVKDINVINKNLSFK